MGPGSHLPDLFAALAGPMQTGPTCLGDDPMFFTLLDNETGQPSSMASYIRTMPASGTDCPQCGPVHTKLDRIKDFRA